MGIKEWVRRKLGIELLDSRTTRLEKLEVFSLQDVVDRLSESMVVLTGEGQILKDIIIDVPPDKSGVIVLGNNTMVTGGYFRPQKTRTIIEIIDDESHSLQGSVKT